MFSSLAPKEAYGHTGWTGTLTIIDPVNNLSIVLLTNRKHSPVLNNKENPHKFVGDTFEIGTYGAVVKRIYEALEK